jgi:hypothetical protein
MTSRSKALALVCLAACARQRPPEPLPAPPGVAEALRVGAALLELPLVDVRSREVCVVASVGGSALRVAAELVDRRDLSGEPVRVRVDLRRCELQAVDVPPGVEAGAVAALDAVSAGLLVAGVPSRDPDGYAVAAVVLAWLRQLVPELLDAVAGETEIHLDLPRLPAAPQETP